MSNYFITEIRYIRLPVFNIMFPSCGAIVKRVEGGEQMIENGIIKGHFLNFFVCFSNISHLFRKHVFIKKEF